MDITTKQLPNLISITKVLRKGEISITQLSKETNIKRSTLNYYLNILEKNGFIEKNRIQEKRTGRPTLIKFNEEKYQAQAKKLEDDFKKEENEMLNHPLTFKLLNFLKENPNPSLKETEEKLGNPYRCANHLNWLIHKGLAINQFNITSEGLKFLEENSHEK